MVFLHQSVTTLNRVPSPLRRVSSGEPSETQEEPLAFWEGRGVQYPVAVWRRKLVNRLRHIRPTI